MQVVLQLTDCTMQMTKADATTEYVKKVTPIKLGKDYKEELKNVITLQPFQCIDQSVNDSIKKFFFTENHGTGK